MRVDAITREINAVKTQMEAARSWCGMAMSRSERGELHKVEYAARRCGEAADKAEEALERLERLKPQESQLLLAMRYANTAKELAEKARASC